MPKEVRQYGKKALTKQAGTGLEGTATNYTPEHMESPDVQRTMAEMHARRLSFENSPGSTRMHSPLRGVGDLDVAYESRGWHDIERQHGAAGPSMGEYKELAESGHNPFPQPTRFEDLPDEEQARAHAGLKAHGTSYRRLVNDLGRGLDRAYSRSSEMGGIPVASNFYEPEGFPRLVIAHHMPEAPAEHAAAAIAMTSPKNKFLHVTNKGAVNMPNINSAVAAGSIATSGRYTTSDQFKKIPGPELNKIGRTVSGGGVGLHGNVRKAGYALHQGAEGADISEWRGFPTKAAPAGSKKGGELGGSLIFGGSPKASPFASSFIDEAAPFHVTDVHMASLAFPHLSSIKGSGKNINPSGASTGTKTERELAVERVPHAHAIIDHAMRTAMGERGLNKIRFQQGAAWGEEQIHRTIMPEPGGRRLGFRPDTVYQWQAATMPHTNLNFRARTKAGVGTLHLPD